MNAARRKRTLIAGDAAMTWADDAYPATVRYFTPDDCGYVALHRPDGDGPLRITRMYVCVKARGKGAAAWLLACAKNEAVRHAGGRDVVTFTAISNTAMRKALIRAGFREYRRSGKAPDRYIHFRWSTTP